MDHYIKTSAFHKPGNLLESMKELVGNSPTEDRLEKALENEREHRRIAAFFEHVKVETNCLLTGSINGKEIRAQIKSGLMKVFKKPSPFLFILLPNESAVLYNIIKLLLNYSVSVLNV